MEPNIDYIGQFPFVMNNDKDDYDFIIPHKLFSINKETYIRDNIKCLSINNRYYHILDDNRNEKEIFYDISQPLRYIHTSISLFGKMSSFLSLQLYYFNMDTSFSLYYSILLQQQYKLKRFINPSNFSYHDHISE
jgi:hypothetical protein